MISIVTGVGVAAAMSLIALWKGRTLWHWFVMTLVGFGLIWLLSVVGLRVAGVTLSTQGADRNLASFAGVVTAAVVVIVLVFVPRRRIRGRLPR